ncbi:MAG: class I SAM-dependent methyltransferase [Coriobacteriia bacterium]|nr:class I SAM-dependent methyltransferase [Coriobacteriia bacterium]
MASPPATNRMQALKASIRTSLILLGTLRKPFPIHPGFGIEVGTSVDRYYIDRFIGQHSNAIRGRVLEIGDRVSTTQFGTGVTQSDVLHFEEGNPEATIVGDLSDCPEIADNTYDCIILVQTLHYIYDMERALRSLHRILAPGGMLLVSVPGISPVSRYDMDHWGDRWRLTTLAARELFATTFDPENTEVTGHGNTLSTICFMEGITQEHLRPRDLEASHPDYELIVTIAAVK